MIYLCLGYYYPEKMRKWPQKNVEAFLQQCQPLLVNLYKTGCVTGENSVTIISQTSGEWGAADELIGSAFLVQAENMEDAITIASGHPSAQVRKEKQSGYHIEIRPVHYFKTIY